MKTDLKIAGDYLDLIVMHPASPEDVPCGEYFYEWDGTEEYSSRKFACSVEKQPDRDFVILNFADIQCHDGEAFCHVGEFSEETMDKLIRRTKPDLITLTGDNAFDPFAYLRLIDFLERYSVPWAPVMGNADHTGLVSEFWADYRMSHAKHCLFRCGPKGMGDGNYIINITEKHSKRAAMTILPPNSFAGTNGRLKELQPKTVRRCRARSICTFPFRNTATHGRVFMTEKRVILFPNLRRRRFARCMKTTASRCLTTVFLRCAKSSEVQKTCFAGTTTRTAFRFPTRALL